MLRSPWPTVGPFYARPSPSLCWPSRSLPLSSFSSLRALVFLSPGPAFLYTLPRPLWIPRNFLRPSNPDPIPSVHSSALLLDLSVHPCQYFPSSFPVTLLLSSEAGKRRVTTMADGTGVRGRRRVYERRGRTERNEGSQKDYSLFSYLAWSLFKNSIPVPFLSLLPLSFVLPHQMVAVFVPPGAFPPSP